MLMLETFKSLTGEYVGVCLDILLPSASTTIVAAARKLNACTISLPASIWYSSGSNQHRRQWVEVAALYYMGMAGHFGLGNTYTLATIDVAGVFIGVLNHSTILSGVLMFIITYASPMLYLLSMVMYNSVKDTSSFIISEKGNIGSLLKRTLGFPCLVPLGLNAILLIAYTIVLLLMRNHLFVLECIFSQVSVSKKLISKNVNILVCYVSKIYVFFYLF